MISSNVYSLGTGRPTSESDQQEVQTHIEDAIRLTISQFGAHRVAMMLLSDEYFNAVMKKAA
jgi:3-mercaptopyruvate sulfurtransferase SseA